MIEYKYFEYKLSKYKGYRRKVEESNFYKFKLLKFEGFDIISSPTDKNKISFKITKKFIRKLKIIELSSGYKRSSDEHRLITLISRSKETTFFRTFSYSYI